VLTLAAWLKVLSERHAQTIELGLERVAEVWTRLERPTVARRVIIVGGTNGKGSTVHMLDSVARAHGLRVGAYTSPHIRAFNERIALDGHSVSDAQLVDAFERVDAALGDTSLTYFEFTTLAAMLIFSDAALDLAVLEVGLGGRLDAVNLLDAHASIVTTVDLDHLEYLGPTIEHVGWEKAHIFRPRRAAICGMSDPPLRLVNYARSIGADLQCLGAAFRAERSGDAWQFQDALGELAALPLPALRAPEQLANAACALRALRAVGITIAHPLLADSLRSLKLAGRMTLLKSEPEMWVDVAHNPQAARSLAQWLHNNPNGHANHAVFACLTDKDARGIFEPLLEHFASVNVVQLEGPRARAAPELAAMIEQLAVEQLTYPLPVATYASVPAAFTAIEARCDPRDRIIAFGSFLIAEQAFSIED